MIKARREARGLTQQELADAIGVSRSVVTKWEKGQREASGRSIRGLERILGSGAEPDSTLTVTAATDVELLTELLRRRLAAERAHGTQVRSSFPAQDLEWDNIDEDDERQDDGGTGQP